MPADILRPHQKLLNLLRPPKKYSVFLFFLFAMIHGISASPATPVAKIHQKHDFAGVTFLLAYTKTRVTKKEVSWCVDCVTDPVPATYNLTKNKSYKKQTGFSSRLLSVAINCSAQPNHVGLPSFLSSSRYDADIILVPPFRIGRSSRRQCM